MFGSVSIIYQVIILVMVCLHWTMRAECAVTVTVMNRSLSVPEGSQTSINCSVLSEAFIGWFDPDGQEIGNDASLRRHVRNNGSQNYLEISNINRSDNGTYECRAEKNKAQVMLHVEYSPFLIREQSTHKTIFSSEGSTEIVTVTCVFDGFPAPNVSFKRAGKELTNNVTKKPGYASYNFRTKGPNDFGFYTCEAENSQGTSQHYIEVYEKGPPEPPSNIQVHADCDRIEVTWEECLNDRGSPVIGYKIELRQGDETRISEALSISSRHKTFKDLDKETLFLVLMNSENALGVGEWERIPVNTTSTCASKGSANPASSASDLSILMVLMMCVHAFL